MRPAVVLLMMLVSLWLTASQCEASILVDKHWAESWEELDQAATAPPETQEDPAECQSDSMGDGNQQITNDNLHLPDTPLIVHHICSDIACLRIVPFEERVLSPEMDRRLKKVPKSFA